VFAGLIVGDLGRSCRAWAMGVLASAVIPFVVIHMWWLPKHGINGWTGEPKDKYKLRGWDR
jgi:hypothetical protein